MSVLNDSSITEMVERRELAIDPFDEESVQPASYDIHTGDTFILASDHPGTWVDADSGEYRGYHDPESSGWNEIEADEIFIPPNDMVLAHAQEHLSLPPYLTASVEPRSSAARLGLFTDGWADPGFEGTLTLELANTTSVPIKISAGESYCQLVFEKTSKPAQDAYGEKESNKYQGQTGVTKSRAGE